MSICPACNGTGPLGAVLGVVCPRCGGSGVVSDAAAQAQTKGGETMSDELKVTVDVANVPAVVQILKEAQEAIDALRAELAAAHEENARLRAQIDYFECALNDAENDTHEALNAFNELCAQWVSIPWEAIEECAVIADDDPDYRRDAKAVQRWIQEAQK